MGKKRKKAAAQINGAAPNKEAAPLNVPEQIAGAIQIANAAREMSTDEARLRWLFEFANRDALLELSLEQLVEQYARVFAFAAKGQTFSSEMLSANRADVHIVKARTFLFEIREALRSGLRQVIELDSPYEGGFVGWETELAGVKRRVRRGRSAYQGPLRTTFLAAVADVIAEDREERFQICAKHTCRRFFWKVGGARYCSRSCADADRQKRWRNKPEIEEEANG